MNILIYSHVQLWEPHHAETLEIALSHIEMGDKVFMLSCVGDLISCPANPYHDHSKCSSCNKITEYGLKRILAGRVTNINLHLKDYLDDYEPGDLKSFLNFNELMSYKSDGIPYGSLVASQIIDDIQDCYADLSPFIKKINNQIKNGKLLYSEVRNQIKINAIDKVYAWNGRRISDGPVYYASKDEGVECEMYISGGKPGTYMTISAPTVMDLDANKFRMNELAAKNNSFENDSLFMEQAKDFYHTQRYGGAYFPGSVHFSKTFQKNKILKSSDKKVLIIYTSSFWEFIAIDTFSGGVYKDHYSGLADIYNDERVKRDYSIIIRWHPNLRNCGEAERHVIDETIRMSGLVGVINFPPESEVDSYDLLEIADIVVTFGSTIGAEASYYRKPSILLGRSWYEGLNVAYTPKTHEEFLNLLARDLPPLPLMGSVIYGYYMRNFGGHYFKYISIDSDFKFRFKGRTIHPFNLRNYINDFACRRFFLFFACMKTKIQLYLNAKTT